MSELTLESLARRLEDVERRLNEKQTKREGLAHGRRNVHRSRVFENRR